MTTKNEKFLIALADTARQTKKAAGREYDTWIIKIPHNAWNVLSKMLPRREVAPVTIEDINLCSTAMKLHHAVDIDGAEYLLHVYQNGSADSGDIWIYPLTSTTPTRAV